VTEKEHICPSPREDICHESALSAAQEVGPQSDSASAKDRQSK